MSVYKAVTVNLREDGLVWMLNTAILHPRGFALGYNPADKTFELQGDGSERWAYEESDRDFSAQLDRRFEAFEAMLQRAREVNK
jgi:hypothetical protein